MKRIHIAPLLIVACCFGMQPTLAQTQAEDGVKVGKPSALRKLVPEDQVEATALQQYTGIKQQASRKGALVPDSDPQVVRLHAIAKKIIPHAARWNERATQWQWEVSLIASNEVNAFCMPGGKIAFYTGLLNSLKLTDDEVAIVMGHEIAHALREHGRERMAKGTLINLGTALGSALLGLKDTGQMLAGQGAKLVMLKFSRSDETEADLVGLDIAARAGYDPRAGIALWQKMGMISKNAPPQWLSTHPAGNSRIEDMQKHLPEVMPLYANAKGTAPDALPPYQSNVKGIAPIR
ncbi:MULTISPECIES: M48 family metallopeptidase [Oxalobacteraceae]|jgi:predicted Zn-dependent protease|uniref:M48 family metallopeptidase n=1 Tax=Oxalobacteraceae TaxID=75682 RepID=UPI0010A3562E|nr:MULTISPECIES: M48 family metallopeptidase [Oxalobacteraceae]HJV83309.1 M48 family metallopeptidase [Noviherbaspirillum sp.]